MIMDPLEDPNFKATYQRRKDELARLIEQMKDLIVDLDDFELVKEINRGAYGTVSSYIEKKTGDVVAIKQLIKKTDCDNLFGRLGFIREIYLTHSLRHPTILTFKGCCFPTIGSQSSDYYLITEFIENGSLEDLLNKLASKVEVPYWSPLRRAIICFGVAVALMYMHNKGVLHRDLKPANILIDKNYEPKVADLGMGRKTEQSGMLMTLDVCTPKYTAPEIFTMNPFYSFPIDVYSFAYILLQCYDPRPIYNSFSNLYQFSQFIKQGRRVPPPADAPSKIKEMIKRCYEQNPNDRPTFFQIVTEMVNDIGSFFPDLDDIGLIDFHKYKEKVLPVKPSPPANAPQYSEEDVDSEQFTLPPLLFTLKNAKPEYEEDQITTLKDGANKGDIVMTLRYAEYLTLSGKVDEAFNLYKISAEAENRLGCLIYGYMLCHGIGCLKNIELAHVYLQKAADQKVPIAYYFLGKIEPDNIAEQIFQTGRELFNEPNCAYEYGLFLEKSGTPFRNSSKNLNLNQSNSADNTDNDQESNNIAMSSNKNLSKSRNFDGLHYSKLGKNSASEEALKCFKEAASLDHPKALYKVGKYAYDNNNFVEAANYWRQGATNAHNVESAIAYCDLLEKGKGVERNIRTAEKLYMEFSKESKVAKARYSILLLQNTDEKGSEERRESAQKMLEECVSTSSSNHSNNENNESDNDDDDDDEIPEAQYYLATLIEGRDSERANELYRKAANCNYPKALYRCALNEIELNKYTEAKSMLEKAKKQNDADSIILLGTLYEENKIVSSRCSNEERARNLYHKAADIGSAEAYLKLALFPANNRSHLHNLQKSCKMGCQEAMIYYGDLLIKQHKISEAIDVLSKVNESNQKGQLLFADALYKGENKEDSFYILDRLISKDDPEAMVQKADILKNSSDKEVIKQAFNLYHKAAERGYNPGLAGYGQFLMNGRAGTRDEAKGLEILRKAAENKCVEGMYYLGIYLINTEREKAVQWITEAADNDFPDALNMLGEFYRTGQYVGSKNTEKAKKYKDRYQEIIKTTKINIGRLPLKIMSLQKAASEGDVEAKLKLGKIYLEGTECQKNEAEAVKYLRQSAIHSNPEGMFLYGKMYEMGIGVQKDIIAAKNWMQKAADQNYQEAKNYLETLKE